MSHRDVTVDVITLQLVEAGLPPAGFNELEEWHPGPHVCRGQGGAVRITWDGSPGSEADGLDLCVETLTNLGYEVRRNLAVDYGRLEVAGT